MENLSNHTTLRVQKDVKQQLAKLDFVSKEYSYNDIIAELIELYNKELKGKRKRE